MRSRKTSDYSPTMKGSKEEQAAINGRREMMNTFASIETPVGKVDKWTRRMVQCARGFELRA